MNAHTYIKTEATVRQAAMKGALDMLAGSPPVRSSVVTERGMAIVNSINAEVAAVEKLFGGKR